MDTFYADKRRWTTSDVASLLVSNNAKAPPRVMVSR